MPPVVLPCAVAFESRSPDLTTLPDVMPNVELLSAHFLKGDPYSVRNMVLTLDSVYLH
jgi:hypothetical protein